MTFPESNSLRSRTVHALSWSFLESVGLKGVQFLIGIVLARLLLPEQFGLIGMLTIFMAVAQSFLDSGFGAALIQKREVTATDTCSIFYFNILAGLTVTGLLWLVAPWIAAFYNQPVLTSLTRALSLTIVINAFGLIQNTILTKGINFKTQTKVSLIAGLLSGIIGVTLAATGFGVWSLAVQQISSTFFRTLFLWLLNAWRPGLVFSLGSLEGDVRFRLTAPGFGGAQSDIREHLFPRHWQVVFRYRAGVFHTGQEHAGPSLSNLVRHGRARSFSGIFRYSG